MKIHQLSVFVSNQPGHLRAPCQILAEAGINLETLSLADTQQYGILRLIIRDWQRAKDVLEAADFVVKVTDVLAVKIPDRPGGLVDVLKIIDEAGINIEYMYAFSTHRDDMAVLIVRFENVDDAIEALEHSEIDMISSVDL